MFVESRGIDSRIGEQKIERGKTNRDREGEHTQREFSFSFEALNSLVCLYVCKSIIKAVFFV